MSHIITKEFIKQFLPDNPTILEAGAHVGRDTLKMKQLWPKSIIHAFEPVPLLFQQLKQHIAPLEDIFCYPYALSDTNSFISFYVSREISAASSLLKPTAYFDQQTSFDKITVKSITLDSWAQQYTITAIDFMWLDLQGAELLALQGGTNLLTTTQVILTEINTLERYERSVLYDQLLDWLQQHGFKLVQKALHKKDWGNALFIKK